MSPYAIPYIETIFLDPPVAHIADITFQFCEQRFLKIYCFGFSLHGSS